MMDLQNVLTILFMACATYLTRTVGYVALRNRKLSARHGGPGGGPRLRDHLGDRPRVCIGPAG